jgi:ribonuclease HIII
MGNLNELLAWAHAQSLEKVLTRNKDCNIAISDQFAWKDILIGKLKQLGKKIELVQRPKAEENIAVAAASILARANYLSSMEYLKKSYQIDFPKGAGNEANQTGLEYLNKGKELVDVAKIHFKNTKLIKVMQKQID